MVVEGGDGVDSTRKGIIFLGFSRREDARSLREEEEGRRERELSDY